jgi:hypothetical protein
MREQSNRLAGPNIAASGGEAVSSKEFLGLMRICSVPKASFPVLQERLVLSVDDFFRIPASAALDNETEQPKKNHQRQQQRGKKQTTVRKQRERGANRTRMAATHLAHAHWGMAREWKAGERRKAQCARAI